MWYFTQFTQLVWVLLPVGFANMAPVLVKPWLKSLDTPISEKRLGAHKTWRGLLAGTVMGGVVFFVQLALLSVLPGLVEWSWYDHTALPLWFGFALGFGALAGDALKSFFKRLLTIQPGAQWFPFDQLDYVLGAMVPAALFLDFSWQSWLVILTAGPALHIVVNQIGYRIKLKDTPW